MTNWPLCKKGNRDKHAVLVEFKEPTDKQLLEEFKHIDSVEEIKPNSYRLPTGNPEAVRKQVLELALKHNLNIISLQSESQSLEDVFRSLTV